MRVCCRAAPARTMQRCPLRWGRAWLPLSRHVVSGRGLGPCPACKRLMCFCGRCVHACTPGRLCYCTPFCFQRQWGPCIPPRCWPVGRLTTGHAPPPSRVLAHSWPMGSACFAACDAIMRCYVGQRGVWTGRHCCTAAHLGLMDTIYLSQGRLLLGDLCTYVFV